MMIYRTSDWWQHNLVLRKICRWHLICNYTRRSLCTESWPKLPFCSRLISNWGTTFLNLELSPIGISIFRKNTNTSLYTHLSCYVPWTHRTAWIKSLTSRASWMCLPNKLSSEINFFKKLASWTFFPTFAVKSIIHQVLNTSDESTNNAESPEVLATYVSMSYYSDKGLSLLESCLRKIRSNCIKTRSIRFMTQYDVNKIGFCCNTKDKTTILSNSFDVYDFSCPGCGASCIGKIERTYERTVEQA